MNNSADNFRDSTYCIENNVISSVHLLSTTTKIKKKKIVSNCVRVSLALI